MSDNRKNSTQIESLKNTVAESLVLAKQRGAEAAQIDLMRQSGMTATVRKQVVDTVTFQRDNALDITVYCGKQTGSVSTNDLSKTAINQAIEAAINIARFTETDPHAGLPETDMQATHTPDLALYHPWAYQPEELIEQAKHCEAFGLEYDDRIHNSEGACVSSHEYHAVCGNTQGFLSGYSTTKHSKTCVLLAKSAQGNMQRSYDYSVARDKHDLDPDQKIGVLAAENTLKRLGARKIKTQKAPVVFDPSMARSLLGHAISAISGGSLYRKRSFFLDKKGQKIFPAFFNLREDPFVKKGLGSCPFDQEGVIPQARDIISEGVLQNYLLSSYSARKLGLKTTGNAGGIHNAFVSTNAMGGQPALLKEMNRGLLVTELMGHGINMTTGDYSRGAFGYWVEGGEIQHPVEEITIAGNLSDLFSRIVMLGDDFDKRSHIITGSLLVEEMSIAGC